MKRFIIVSIFLAIAISSIFLVKPILFQGCEGYYSGILGSVLAALFAAFLVWVAWVQLNKLSKTSSADFIHKLNTDFFTPEARTLMSLITCGALEFKSEGRTSCWFRITNFIEPSSNIEAQPYFEVNLNKLNKTKLPKEIKKRLRKWKYYSAWEVDDFLLGHFEDVGRLEQRGIVDFQMVYDVFSWYLKTAWEYDPIKEYIRSQRDGKKDARIDTIIYNQFQYIVTKCIEYDDIHPGPCMWWWKFKRYFRGPRIEIEI